MFNLPLWLSFNRVTASPIKRNNGTNKKRYVISPCITLVVKISFMLINPGQTDNSILYQYKEEVQSTEQRLLSAVSPAVYGDLSLSELL